MAEPVDGVLEALPRLSAEEQIPEVNGMMIDAAGKLVPRARKQQQIVTFTFCGRRVTARFSGGRDHPITMEVGCRLLRLPYSIESPERRRMLIDRIVLTREKSMGWLSVTHHQWLYLRDSLVLGPERLTASWMMTQLVTEAWMLKPTIDAFVALDTN